MMGVLQLTLSTICSACSSSPLIKAYPSLVIVYPQAFVEYVYEEICSRFLKMLLQLIITILLQGNYACRRT